MNKNLLYLILLFSPHIQSMTTDKEKELEFPRHIQSKNSDKEAEEHPDIVVKYIKNDTDYPIEVTLGAENKVVNLRKYSTLKPRSIVNANISIPYLAKNHAYAQLAFKWLKPDAPDVIPETDYVKNFFKNMVIYTPTGVTKELNIKLIENPNQPGELEIIKAPYGRHRHKKDTDKKQNNT